MSADLPAAFELLPNRVWRTYLGGRTLDEWAGTETPEDAHFPEDWIGSVVPARNIGREALTEEGLSRVMHHGQPVLLKDLIDQHPSAFLGPHAEAGRAAIGFLAKLLDSSIRLHIQAHPTRAFAKRRLGSDFGKAEGYVILATRPEVADPYVLIGFQRPPDRAAYRRAVLDQDIDKILEPFDRIPVGPGDVFYVPGGVPHAIGPGVMMLEVMEPSDLAVRLEFERGGYVLPESARFMGHDVDLAMDLIDFSPRPIERVRAECFAEPIERDPIGVASRSWAVIDDRLTDRFSVDRLEIDGEAQYTPRGFEVFLVTRGAGRLEGQGVSLDLCRGTRGVLRAEAGLIRLCSAEAPLEVLVVRS
ncbi:MAG: class I mannose-6-phosphate isomerase [Planctomycetota bacterium]